MKNRAYDLTLPLIPQSWYPDIDVIVATHNEPVELLYKTVNALTYMDYPDKSKVHIYIADDGNRPEMGKLAQQFGGCFIRDGADFQYIGGLGEGGGQGQGQASSQGQNGLEHEDSPVQWRKRFEGAADRAGSVRLVERRRLYE